MVYYYKKSSLLSEVMVQIASKKILIFIHSFMVIFIYFYFISQTNIIRLILIGRVKFLISYFFSSSFFFSPLSIFLFFIFYFLFFYSLLNDVSKLKGNAPISLQLQTVDFTGEELKNGGDDFMAILQEDTETANGNSGGPSLSLVSNFYFYFFIFECQILALSFSVNCVQPIQCLIWIKISLVLFFIKIHQSGYFVEN